MAQWDRDVLFSPWLFIVFFSLAYPAVFLWHQSSRASLADLFSLDSSSYNTKKYHVILGCVHCCLLVFNQANSVWTIEHNLYLLKTISISERLFCFPLWLIKCISLSARIHWWKSGVTCQCLKSRSLCSRLLLDLSWPIYH